ncbi:MAG: recombination protein O N-terminal domain-containing protein [Parcubacteria group bacterium]|nr:recombination protein O N-terminal domain-containing protein [Parcubacteria group bacterium]
MLQTTAFILSEEPQGEADRSYILFAEELGKIYAFAKAVRKPSAKLAGHLEPLNRSWVMLVEASKNGKESWQVTQALEEETYRDIRDDGARFHAALRACELLHQLLPPGMQEAGVMDMWKSFLRELGKSECDPEFLFAQFACRTLNELGFFPEVTALNIHPRTKGVLAVILKDVWLPRSSESRAVIACVEGATQEARQQIG